MASPLFLMESAACSIFSAEAIQMDGNIEVQYFNTFHNSEHVEKLCPSEPRYQTNQMWAMPFLRAGCFGLNQ